MKKNILSNKNNLREHKWHNTLKTEFSIDFWKSSWKLVSDIKFENGLRWLQYQIVRNCLQTNYIVNKSKPQVSPLCSYCGNETGELERVFHLFWLCNHVKQFWSDLTDLCIEIGTYLPLERNKIIFGLHDEPPDSENNFIILNAKHYIWANKFRVPHTPLCINAFKNIIKFKIDERMNVAKFLKDAVTVERWNNVLLLL